VKNRYGLSRKIEVVTIELVSSRMKSLIKENADTSIRIWSVFLSSIFIVEALLMSIFFDMVSLSFLILLILT
jgi:hypothetical protein